MKKILLAMVAALAIGLIYLYNNPANLVLGLNLLADMHKGITRHSLQLDGEDWVYNTKGTGEPLVLVHGFGGSKESWDAVLPLLAEHYQVIAVDLPGFGESSKNPDKNFTIASQTVLLNHFVRQLGLKQFYLAGNSMGGAIAGEYAAKYPHKVKGLWLISPAGVQAAEPSEFETHFDDTGDNIMVAATNDQFDGMLAWLFYTPPKVPWLVKSALVMQGVKNADFLDYAYEDLLSDWAPLEDALENFEVPVLITWGANDRITHVSGAQALADILPDVELQVLPRCGHVAMLEYPEITAQKFIAFAKAAAERETPPEPAAPL